MSSGIMPVLAIIAAICVFAWVIGYGVDLRNASKQKAWRVEINRLLNQSPAACVAYQTLETEVRAVLRQMGLQTVSITFNA